MRHFLAVLLMLLVPLQFIWSSVESMHGHLGDEISASGFHYHDDDHDHHHDAGLDDQDDLAAGDTHNGHNDDGHHDGHYHPIFSMLLIEPDLKMGEASPNGPPVRPLSSFTSHIPSLFDWPPSALI